MPEIVPFVARITQPPGCPRLTTVSSSLTWASEKPDRSPLFEYVFLGDLILRNAKDLCISLAAARTGIPRL